MTNFSNIRPPSIRSIMRSRALKAAVKALRGIEEPKMRGKTKHPSWQSALICAVSMMAGGDFAKDAASFAARNRGRLAKAFGKEGWLPPSYPTLLRSLHALAPHSAEVESALLRLLGGPAAGHCQIDGKLIRATRDGLKDNSAVDVVELRIGGRIAMSVPCGPGSKEASENAAIMSILKAMGGEIKRSGGVLTIDGIAAKRAVASELSRLGIPFAIVIKNEGRGLGEAIADNFRAYGGELVGRLRSSAVGGRAEERGYYVLPSMGWVWRIYGGKPWEGVGGAGMGVRGPTDRRTGKATRQVRCCILSEGLGLRRFAEARAEHWGIEAFHWLVDNSFREDRCRFGRGRPESAGLLSAIRKKACEIILELVEEGEAMSEARREMAHLPFSKLLYVFSGLAARREKA